MPDITDLVPAARELPPARAQALRTALEEAVRAPQPRRSLPATPRVLVPAALVVVVVAAIAVFSTVFAPKPAYASWTARPGTLGNSETAQVGADCARSVHERFPMAAADLRPVLGERRGTFKTALLASGPQLALCAAWLGDTGAGTNRGDDLAGLVLDAAPDPSRTVQTIAVPGQLSGPDAARIAYGFVSANVAAVTVTTEDGKQVFATVAGGCFLAWWPSGAGAARIEAFDAAGRFLGFDVGR